MIHVSLRKSRVRTVAFIRMVQERESHVDRALG